MGGVPARSSVVAMLIAQISDCHIVERGALFADRVDSAAGLRAAVAAIGRLDRTPDVVLATGDLVNDGAADQYDHLMDLIADLDMPVIPVVGNHDDRSELRRRFPDTLPSGDPDSPIAFTVDTYPLRIIVLDSTIPGRNDGRLGVDQLDWLDSRLSEQPDRPTLVVQHHPPFASGISWMDDDCGFADSEAERVVLARHHHVEGVVAGHLHRSITRRYANTVAIVCPSTAAALDLDLTSSVVGYSTEPTGFLLHDWRPGVGMSTHVVTNGEHRRWTPSWAD